MIDFTKIDYLKNGNIAQQEIYEILVRYQIIEKLNRFNPIVVGTFPIDINISTSDVDIIGCTTNLEASKNYLNTHFSNFESFTLNLSSRNNSDYVLCNFSIKNLEFEIYLENKPSEEQNAYKHMIIEYQILKIKGEKFRNQIINLKNKGYNTEESFTKLLNLSGNPFEALLEFDINSL